jgi:hypothetical protein
MNKGKKTTAAAYAVLALIIALFVALFLDKITVAELKDGIMAITGGAVVVVAFFAKDYDKTHSQK